MLMKINKIKRIGINTLYLLAAIGMTDMVVQGLTSGEFKLIHYILGLFLIHENQIPGPGKGTVDFSGFTRMPKI